MRQLQRIALLLGCMCCLVLACEEEEDRPLNQQERKLVSQIYADSVRSLTPIVDSICTAQQDDFVQRLADSIYAERLADINRQRKRFGHAEE